MSDCYDLNTRVEHHQPNNLIDAFFLEQTTEQEVLAVIEKVKNSHAKDLFNIDTSFLKRNKEILVKPITHLVNLSFKNGEFPNDWKQSRVIPIYKSGKVDLACNYRPISILPFFSKVLEKIVANQLMSFLQFNDIPHPLQFGFQPQYSTETANCYFIEQLKLAIDKGQIVGAVFMDIKKNLRHT